MPRLQLGFGQTCLHFTGTLMIFKWLFICYYTFSVRLTTLKVAN